MTLFMTIVTNSALPLFSPSKIRYNEFSNIYGGFPYEPYTQPASFIRIRICRHFQPACQCRLRSCCADGSHRFLSELVSNRPPDPDLAASLIWAAQFPVSPVFLFLSGHLLRIFYSPAILFRFCAGFLFSGSRLFFAPGQFIFPAALWSCLQFSALSDGRCL